MNKHVTKTKNISLNRNKVFCWMVAETEFTLPKLVDALGVDSKKAGRFIEWLSKHERLEVVQNRIGRIPAIYRVCDSSPLPNLNRPVVRQRCWNSIRVLKKFSIADVATGADCSYSQASLYLTRLRRAGFIRCVQSPRADVAGVSALLFLQYDSGPKAPVPDDEHDQMLDPNTGKRHSYAESEPQKARRGHKPGTVWQSKNNRGGVR